jgi:hypothetical protein
LRQIQTGRESFIGRTLGRPRGRWTHSRASFFTVPFTHRADPKGLDRITDCRTASSSSVVCGRFTVSSQFRGRSTGYLAYHRRFAAPTGCWGP